MDFALALMVGLWIGARTGRLQAIAEDTNDENDWCAARWAWFWFVSFDVIWFVWTAIKFIYFVR